MRIRSALLLIATLASLLPAGFAQGAASNGEFKIEYYAENNVYSFCDKEPIPGTSVSTGQNLGAVCVEVNGNKKARIKSIVDDASEVIRFSYYWLDATWTEVGKPALTADPVTNLTVSGPNHGNGCSSDTPKWVEAPAGAKYFYVFVSGVVSSALSACDLGMSTHGFITIEVANK